MNCKFELVYMAGSLFMKKKGMEPMKEYIDYVYEIVKNELGDFDALYEDYIINLVGHAGLTELRSNKLLEACGVVEGRQLYAIVSRK